MANNKEELRKLIGNKIAKWIRDAGYESVTAFCRSTKIKISTETVCRIVEGRGASMPSPFTLFLIMGKLNVSPEEMRSMLIDAGDEELHKLIGKRSVLSEEEEALISSVRKCVNKRNDVSEDIYCSVKTWAKIAGISLTHELAAIESWIA